MIRERFERSAYLKVAYPVVERCTNLKSSIVILLNYYNEQIDET